MLQKLKNLKNVVQIIVDENGEYVPIYGNFSRYRDIYGNPVEKTKDRHPYSYDEYVVIKNGDNNEVTSAVYSDRLDLSKSRKLMVKHYGTELGYFSDWDTQQIESFLSDYYEEDIKLVMLVQGCNNNSGYPYWIFYMKK